MESNVRFLLATVAVGCLAFAGCASTALKQAVNDAAMSDIPRELEKASLPVYRVEPPDILTITAVNNIRLADDPIHAGDAVDIEISNGHLRQVQLSNDQSVTERESFKKENVLVQSDGTIDVGPDYGSFVVEGMTRKEAQATIEKAIREKSELVEPEPTFSLSLKNINARQTIAGEHLIRPDGTVSMGIYGSVHVAGMTLDEVKQAVEDHLRRFIYRPEVEVDVLAYNSKTIYVISDGGGQGEVITKLPFTGNETVLDALAEVQGLSEVSSKTMWVARPAPNGTEVAQTMLVDYRAISQDGVTTTNYQLMPGDRVYIKADDMVSFDNAVAKITIPFSRIFGFILLGNGTVRTLQKGNSIGGGGGGGGGFF